MADTSTVELFLVEPVRPKRYSMSFMRSAEGCLRRAHMERDDTSVDPMSLTGRVFHEVAAVIGFRCVMRGEVEVSVRDAQAIAKRVMENPEDLDPLPFEVHGSVLDLVGRWARRVSFRPGEAFEINSRQELAGRVLSARIDRELVEDGVAWIRDYKTGWVDPAKELTSQGRNYCWHTFRRYPQVHTIVYSEEHVRFNVAPIPFQVTRDELPSIESYLVTAVRRLDEIYERGGTLPATPGSICSSPSRCPVASSCPAPKWAREATAIEDRDDALEQFEALIVEEQAVAARKSALRGYVEALDERALQHNGEEIGYSDKPGKSFQKKQLGADLAVANGAPVDLKDYEVETKPSFGRRKASK